jgi:hypothetical protein
MKPFSDYVMQMRPRYEFVVRLAECDDAGDLRELITQSLAMYVVENVGTAKRLPIQEHKDFVGLGPCQVHMLEVTLRYPTITEQVRRNLAQTLGVSASRVCVRTRLEEDQHDFQPSVKTASDGSVLNRPELDAESGQQLVGQPRIDSMLKELGKNTKKHEIAGHDTVSKNISMPQGTASPVGSRAQQRPSIKGR